MALAGPLALVFRWVLRTSAQASVLICLILVVQAVLRRKLAPRWHYALWFLLIARLAMPWAPESGLSLFNLFSFRQQSPTTFVLEEISTAPVTAPDVVVRVSEPQNYTPARATVPRRAWTWRRLRRSVLYSEAVPMIWLIGAIALAVYGLAESFVLSLRVRGEPALTEKTVLDLLEKCREEMGVRASPIVVQSPRVDSPSLFGLIRPRLMLPQGMVDTLDSDQLRYVFLHELAHLKRRDLAVNWLTTLLQVVHWFNPLIWYAFYRVRADREVACDAHTLSRTNPGESKLYGQTIVHLLERFSQPRRLPTAVGILEDKSQLKRRITMIAQFKKYPYRWSAMAVALLAVLACVALTDARGAPEKDEENTATSEPSAEEQAEAARAEKIEAMHEKLQTLVELDFDRGTDIRDVVDLISRSYKVNIVLDDRVVLPPEGTPARRIGRIEPTVESAMPRIYLPRIPLDEALEAILKPAGLAYKVLPEFIWVSTPDVLRTELFEPVESRFVLPSATDNEKKRLAAGLDKMKNILLNGTIQVDFDGGTDIRDVLDFLSNFYDMNIVLDERVILPAPGTAATWIDDIEPSVDPKNFWVNLQNIPLGNALVAMLTQMGLDYRVLPDLIWVSTPAVLRTESFASVESRLALPPMEPELTGSLKEKLDRRLAELSGMASVDFDPGTDISDVLDYISAFYKVNIVLDERVMLSPDGAATQRAEGIEPTIPREAPRINVKNIPVGEALVALSKQMGLDYRILPEHVWISASDVLRRETKPLKSLSPGDERIRRQGADQYGVLIGPDAFSRRLRKDQEGPLVLGDDEPVLRRIQEIGDKLDMRGNWDLDKGSDIRQILDVASNSYDVNIVLDERVMLSADTDAPTKRGAVEASGKNKLQEAVLLTDVPLGEALRIVLSQLGLEYTVQPEFLWVSTPYVLAHESYEELETRYFLVDDAEWAAELLAKLRDKAPEIKDLNTGETLSYADFSPTTNLLIFHNTPSNFEIIEDILNGLEPGARETTSGTMGETSEEHKVPAVEPPAVAKRHESTPQRFLDAAIALYEQRNYAEALEHLEHALFVNSKDEVALKYGRDCALHLAGGAAQEEETKAILSKIREYEAKLEDMTVSFDYPKGTDISEVLAFFEKRVGVKIVLDERVMLPPPTPEAVAADAAPAAKEGPKAVEAAERRARQLLVHPTPRLLMLSDAKPMYFEAEIKREPIVPTVARKTSRILLKNVAVGDALRAVLARMGLDYRVQPDFIWVSTPYVLRHETYESPETRYYVLHRAAANTVVSELRQFVPHLVEPETGRVLSYLRASPVPGLLVVRHVPSVFETVAEVIKYHEQRKGA